MSLAVEPVIAGERRSAELELAGLAAALPDGSERGLTPLSRSARFLRVEECAYAYFGNSS